MLVLSRKPGEAVWVGSEVTITVLEVQGKRVRLGISAPENVKVVRGELDQFPPEDAETACHAGCRCEFDIDHASAY